MTPMQEEAQPTVRVEVLGPLRLVVDGHAVEVPGPRRRAVLALLALAGGRAVSVDELLDAAWPAGVPDSGRRALHSHVSRLRSHLGPCADRLAREGDAYRLVLGAGELDATVARAAAESTDPATLVAALGLWRGSALEEFADVAPLGAEAAGLAELRLDLTDRWLEARLAAGGDPELVTDATRAAAAAPLRERTLLVVVRALAAEGRQAEAMRAAHAFRRNLVEETGFDPTPAVDEVERAIAAGSLLRAEAAAAPRHRSLVPASPLVGREDELGLLRRRLDGGRLVTVVGTGGVGKTRLALEAAAAGAAAGAEVVVVELAGAGDRAGAVDALAAAAGVHSSTVDDALRAAQSVLAAQRALVVLDNCEHLLDVARELALDLLDAGPDVQVLATSREPLGVAEEHLLRLGPLDVPDGLLDPRDAPAFEAFVAHARRRDPSYSPADADVAVVAEIVRRLDGLPLALELAAGRIGSLAVGDLRDRLGRALDVLGSGRRSDARHGTLRSTIDWSYRLLDAGEQRLLRALALLPAGFDLTCAELVADRLWIAGDAAAAVAHLVDASVLVADLSPEGARYRLLETIRAFAVDELDAVGDRPLAEAALVGWALDLTAELGDLALGPAEPQAHARLRVEVANLTAVRTWADLDDQVALCLHLEGVLTFGGHPELTAWVAELAARPDLDGHPERCRVLGLGAQAAWLRGELDLAVHISEEAEALASSDLERVQPLSSRATVALFRGDHDRAVDLYVAAADHAGRPTTHRATAALAACYAGEEDRAAALLQQAFAEAEAAGIPSLRAWACYVRGELEARHDDAAAVTSYTEAIELARLAGTSFTEGTATVGLVSVWARQGQLLEALEGYRWLVDYWRRAGNWIQLWTTLRNLAGVLAEAGDPHCALFVLLAADHAPESSLVDEATATEHERLRRRLDTELGQAEARRVWERAAALPRTSVVDEALEAVELALAGGRLQP